MRTIVVGFDGSDPGERALVRAAELAGALAAKLVVVCVGRPSGLAAAEGVPEPAEPVLVPGAAGPTPSPVPLPPPARVAPAEEQLLLERARSLLLPRRVDADLVAEVGDAAERLTQVADERDAELIVVGHPEHGMLERLVRLPVEEKLARRARRDVLLVR
jgi:nucleotide-binding universal stress UspA family protein